MNNYRLVKVYDEELGHFHCWEQYSDVIPPSPLQRGPPGGQFSRMFAIVEFPDGSVRRVDITDLKFVDETNFNLFTMNEHFKEKGNAEN